MFDAIRQVISDIYSSAVRYFRTREVVKVLKIAHSVELSELPGEQWPITRAKHARQIAEVRAGKFDIVDRRSLAYPYLPEALHRLGQPILKATPYNMRRFSETPIPRRAINLIKNALMSLKWELVVSPDFTDNPERQKRIKIGIACLKHPNNQDTYDSLMEAVIEDVIIGGYGCIEPQITKYYKRPFKMWAVDGSTIRIYADWTEAHPERAHYAQMTGFKGEMGIQNYRDDELIYIRDNVRTNTPFGLGKLEVAFNSVNAFLGVQDMSGRAGSDQIHKTWLWWSKPQSAGHLSTVIRHTQNEGEGQAKISFMSGMEEPTVLDVKAVDEKDLLLGWQEFLIRIISQAFDLTPFALGLEKDVNRNTSETMSTTDFRSAVKPMARRFETAVTIGLFHRVLGWKDIEFRYIGLDDPDLSTMIDIFAKEDTLDAVTPDEVRKARGRPPIEGGFGKLTKTQRELLLYETRYDKDKSQMQQGQDQQGSNQGMGLGLPTQSRPMPGTMFSASDVAQMKPEKVQQLQQMNLLPPNQQLTQKMEEQEPGVLKKIAIELKEYFDFIDEEEDEAKIKPEKIKKADEDEQQSKYTQTQKRQKESSNYFDKLTDADLIAEENKKNQMRKRSSSARINKKKK